MANNPTPGKNLIQGYTPGGEGSPGAAVAPWSALEGVGQQLQSMGDRGVEHLVKLQRLDNGRIVSEKRQLLALDAAKFQADLQTDPDPQSRIKRTQQFLYEYKDRLVDESMAPEVRDELLQHYSGFQSEMQIRQLGDSVRLTENRAKLAFGNELKTSINNGDRDAFETAKATARNAGVILPEDEVRFDDDFNRSVSSTTLDLAIQDDPALVLEDIERPDFLTRVPGFTPEDIPHLRSAARTSAQRHRGEQIDLMEAALDTGHLTPKDIEAGDYLTPGDVAKFQKALVKVDPPTPEIHGKAWDKLLENRKTFNDPAISDRDYAEKWNDLRTEVIAMVPKAFRGDISQELIYRSPANRNEAKKKPRAWSDKQELKSIGLDRITRARTSNMFGNVGEDADTPGKEKAYRRAEELRLEVARFIESTPDLTIEQVTEFTDSRISGDRVKTSAREFQNFVPGGAQRLRPMVPLPGMAPGQGPASDALLPPRTQLENFLK